MIVLRRSFRVGDALGGRGIALAVGNFDGAHVGHRALLARIMERESLAPACMTFEPHPRTVLRPEIPNHRVCGPADKLRLLSRLGVAAVFLPRFTRAFARTSAEEFADILLRQIGAKRIVVGENFQFGKERRGNCALLADAAKSFGAEVIAVPLLKTAEGEPISSGRIRDALATGDFAAAEKMLGRAWTLRGRVAHGFGYGRQLGFPTANLHLSFRPPARGIFAAAARVEGENRARPAAVSVGVNPSVSNTKTLKAEAHLPGFDGRLYGRVLTLRPLVKLRDEEKYDSAGELQNAMAGDVSRTMEIWEKWEGREKRREGEEEWEGWE